MWKGSKNMDDNREFDFQGLLKDTQTTGEEDALSSDIVVKPVEMVTGVITTLAKELGLTLEQVKDLVTKIGSENSASNDEEPDEEDEGPVVDQKAFPSKSTGKSGPGQKRYSAPEKEM
jgi:hypothetical protein